MDTKLSAARKKFIAQAEKALGRPLNLEEIKAVRGFDEFVVKAAVKSFSNEEIAGMLDDVCGEDSPVLLLEKLAAGDGSLATGRRALLKFLNPKARTIVEGIELHSEAKRFSRWFLGLLQSNPPPASIRALNFGLFESNRGCRLYVAGAKAYDKDDSDWACLQDWLPEGRYAPLDALLKVYRLIRRTGTEPWVVAQAIAILIIRVFFNANRGKIENLLGRRRIFVATGFDDGDLYTIRTPISPKVKAGR